MKINIVNFLFFHLYSKNTLVLNGKYLHVIFFFILDDCLLHSFKFTSTLFSRFHDSHNPSHYFPFTSFFCLQPIDFVFASNQSVPFPIIFCLLLLFSVSVTVLVLVLFFNFLFFYQNSLIFF